VKPQPATLNPQPTVRLHLDRVVLDGFPTGSVLAPVFQAALQEELVRLLAQAAPTDRRSRALARLIAQPVTLAGGGTSAAWSRQIARALLTTAMPQIGGQTTPKPAVNAPGRAK
jgi:hypothetical protein